MIFFLLIHIPNGHKSELSETILLCFARYMKSNLLLLIFLVISMEKKKKKRSAHVISLQNVHADDNICWIIYCRSKRLRQLTNSLAYKLCADLGKIQGLFWNTWTTERWTRDLGEHSNSASVTCEPTDRQLC